MFKRIKNKSRQLIQQNAQNQTGQSLGSEGAIVPPQNGTLPDDQRNLANGRDPIADSTLRESLESQRGHSTEVPTCSSLPDFMTDPNAVAEDAVPWRHNQRPDYQNTTRKYLKERTNIWPAGSLEDLASNLIRNWKKESSHKSRTADLRTMNIDSYKFSCNGGRVYNAEEMMEVGTSNALIQEAAFYSAKHTSFDESNKIFQNAMPDGFCWEVVEVYSGPPVMAFKWRHWGQMTGNLVCPIGPDTKLEAEATGEEVELWGLCVAHLDYDFKITKLEVFYDPHELMASLVDANNISFKSPSAKHRGLLSEDHTEQPLDRARRNILLDTERSEFVRGKEESDEEEDKQAVRALGGNASFLLHQISPASARDASSSSKLRTPAAERDDSAYLHMLSGAFPSLIKPKEHVNQDEGIGFLPDQNTSPRTAGLPSTGYLANSH